MFRSRFGKTAVSMLRITFAIVIVVGLYMPVLAQSARIRILDSCGTRITVTEGMYMDATISYKSRECLEAAERARAEAEFRRPNPVTMDQHITVGFNQSNLESGQHQLVCLVDSVVVGRRSSGRPSVGSSNSPYFRNMILYNGPIDLPMECVLVHAGRHLLRFTIESENGENTPRVRDIKAIMGITNERPNEDISRVIAQNMGALRHAYNRRLNENPGLSGVITINFRIDGFGNVIFAEMTNSTINDPELERIVLERVRSMAFSVLGNRNDITEVTWPFEFGQ